MTGINPPLRLRIELSWPDACLWPNHRAHWSKKAQSTKEAREESMWLTTLGCMRIRPSPHFVGSIPLRIIGHKPNARKRDLDNFQAACKAYLDGIAQALSVDDARFQPVTEWGDDKRPGGGVTMVIG